MSQPDGEAPSLTDADGPYGDTHHHEHDHEQDHEQDHDLPGSGLPAVLQVVPLGAQWPTLDPFLFCAHHDDLYPKANQQLGPDASLEGRQIGSDFALKDGWNMYHGSVVPGFPQHPHRGFETVSYLRDGLIDHADSLGATARFGAGDVQWMTAGKGIVHSEMFPLLDSHEPNPVHMFQIWINLPAEDKMVEPHFSMLWASEIPTVVNTDEQGKTTRVTLVAGRLGDTQAPAPAPHSWAARAESHVDIWHLEMDAGATWQLPPTANTDVMRVLYFYEGDTLTVEDAELTNSQGGVLDPSRPLTLRAGQQPARALVLAGVPIGEPVAQHGPFVMNTSEEIEATVQDYQRTRFGGWPWASPDPHHGPTKGRFAQHADGTLEHPPTR